MTAGAVNCCGGGETERVSVESLVPLLQVVITHSLESRILLWIQLTPLNTRTPHEDMCVIEDIRLSLYLRIIVYLHG